VFGIPGVRVDSDNCWRGLTMVSCGTRVRLIAGPNRARFGDVHVLGHLTAKLLFSPSFLFFFLFPDLDMSTAQAMMDDPAATTDMWRPEGNELS